MNQKTALTPPPLLESIREFMHSFEAVFHVDWDTTRTVIEAADETLISPHGSFLAPQVADESNNWANRGSLLARYRALLAALEREGIYASSIGDEIL